MNNLFDHQEDHDFQALLDLNSSKHWFEHLDRLPPKSHADASGTTRDGRKVIIELKSRNMSLTDDNSHLIANTRDGGQCVVETVYIEGHKIASLMLDSLDGFTPLYINFLTNGTVIFNLSKLKRRPREEVMRNVYSKGYMNWEEAKRQGLWIDDAAIVR